MTTVKSLTSGAVGGRIRELSSTLSTEQPMSRDAIFEASVEYFLNPIGPFLADEEVTEVMVNRFDQVYIEKGGRLFETEARFESEDALLSAVHNIAQSAGRERHCQITKAALYQ